MLTEENKQTAEQAEYQERFDFNNQIVVAAAKYERILVNRDFLEILKDMQNVKEILDKELLTLSKQLIETDDPIERKTVLNEFINKSIRCKVINEAITYPELIVGRAFQAKEENTEIRKKLKEKSNG